jgi:hypothetical protein
MRRANFTLKGTESQHAQDLLEHDFPARSGDVDHRRARGDVAGTFGACAGAGACGRQDLYLVVRRAGRSPQPSIRIDDAAGGWLSTAAVNPRGDALVTWQARGGVSARIALFPAMTRRAERVSPR